MRSFESRFFGISDFDVLRPIAIQPESRMLLAGGECYHAGIAVAALRGLCVGLMSSGERREYVRSFAPATWFILCSKEGADSRIGPVAQVDRATVS